MIRRFLDGNLFTFHRLRPGAPVVAASRICGGKTRRVRGVQMVSWQRSVVQRQQPSLPPLGPQRATLFSCQQTSQPLSSYCCATSLTLGKQPIVIHDTIRPVLSCPVSTCCCIDCFSSFLLFPLHEVIQPDPAGIPLPLQHVACVTQDTQSHPVSFWFSSLPQGPKLISSLKSDIFDSLLSTPPAQPEATRQRRCSKG